jgi:hypothetical protein
VRHDLSLPQYGPPAEKPAERPEEGLMERTTHQTIVFLRPFSLPDVDSVLPPGRYDVESVEEQIDGLSFVAYRRVSTSIMLNDPRTGARQIVSVEPNDLAAAQRRDAEPPALLL